MMWRPWLCLLAGLISTLAAAGPGSLPGPLPGPLPEPLPQALRTQLEALLKASTVRGAAIVLVNGGGPTGALWYGMADEAQAVPMTAATCQRAGSVSKTFTALLAMRLADQGKLELDAPLPADLQPAAADAGAGQAACTTVVTLAQLLEHTAGLGGSSHADYGQQMPDAPVAAVAAQIVQRPLAWCPGLHYSYSNDGITLAAAVLERAGGADFDTLMEREVFSPLGIQGASFKTADMPACLSRSYAADGQLITQPWQLAVRPAGALVSTPLDLARVVQMLLRYGHGPAGHLLEPCSMAHMAAGTTGLAGRQGAASGAYGKGLFRFVAADRLMIGHWGRIDGFQTTLGFDPDTGLGMVIMLNTADRKTMHALREAVATHLWRDTPAPLLPGLGKPAAGITGWYANASHDMPLRAPWVALLDLVRIEQDASGLALRGLWPWAPARRVLAVSETSFRDEALPLPSMAFARDAEGRRWWVDGESYAEVKPALALTKLGLLMLGLIVAVAAVLAAVLGGLGRGLRRARGRSNHSSPISSNRRTADRWLALSGASYLMMFGGYAAFGLFGSSDALAQLGDVSAVSLGLATASLAGPVAAAWAAVSLWRKKGGPLRWLAALLLIALGALCWANGWLPLLTWVD